MNLRRLGIFEIVDTRSKQREISYFYLCSHFVFKSISLLTSLVIVINNVCELDI